MRMQRLPPCGRQTSPVFTSKRMSRECAGPFTRPPKQTVIPPASREAFVMHGVASYGVLHEVHKLCCEPNPQLVPYPNDKHELDVEFGLLKALARQARCSSQPSPTAPYDTCIPRCCCPWHGTKGFLGRIPLFVLKQLFAFSFFGQYSVLFLFFLACTACEHQSGWET